MAYVDYINGMYVDSLNFLSASTFSTSDSFIEWNVYDVIKALSTHNKNNDRQCILWMYGIKESCNNATILLPVVLT